MLKPNQLIYLCEDLHDNGVRPARLARVVEDYGGDVVVREVSAELTMDWLILDIPTEQLVGSGPLMMIPRHVVREIEGAK